MHRHGLQTTVAVVLVWMLILAVQGGGAAETPRRGGILTYVVPDEPPSFDGHRETTFALIHPIAPFYSTLIRVHPENPASLTDFVGDLALHVPASTHDGTIYTFPLRRNATFWDGQAVTAHDVVATFNKIIFPPEGVLSPRKALYSMVDKVYAADDYTVVFVLKYPSAVFIPALANPFNFIYSAQKLAQNPRWYEKNILGSGPFIFVQHQAGAFLEGRRNPHYYEPSRPYLDGFRATFAEQQALRVQAIRDGQALIEFRGFPPRIRDTLKNALGDQIMVQESDWNCVLMVTPNHLVQPFDDPRVRRALTLAIDRWGGSDELARNTVVKTVGGITFPGHPLAATRQELQDLAGYWPDLKQSRAEARRLLREAGVPEGFTFKFHLRDVDQPDKIVGLWLITQWRSIGLQPEEWVQPTDRYFSTLRSGTAAYAVSIDFNCGAVVQPLLDVAKFLSNDRSGNNWANYQDRTLDELLDKMHRTTDVAEQRRLLRQFERHALDEQAHMLIILWWHRIVAHHSNVRGWKISPSHYQNQDLANVWLAP